MKQICVCVSDFREPIVESYVQGVLQEANALDYRVNVFSMLQLSEHFLNGEDRIYDLIDWSRYDGLIFVTRSFAPHMELQKALEARIRSECRIPVLSYGDSDCFTEPSFDADDVLSEALTNHLLEKHDCRTIYYLGGEKGTRNKRLDGFRTALVKHHLPVSEDCFLYGGYWTGCAEKLAKQLAFGELAMPDAVMCVSDVVALALIKNLSRYGVRVPEDVMVTGFDGRPSSFNQLFSLTTAESNAAYTGRCAMAVLYHEMTGEPAPSIPVGKPLLSLGLSCGCGMKKRPNLRAHLEAFDKQDFEAMEFRNSRIREHLYTASDYDDLVEKVKILAYLFPDAESFSINLYSDSDDANATCIFLHGSLDYKTAQVFPKTQIYPDGYPVKPIRNTFIVPLIFNERMLGFFTIGYADAQTPRKQDLEFSEHVSIALMIAGLRSGNSAAVPDSISYANDAQKPLSAPEFASSVTPRSAAGGAALFALKGNETIRINYDQILFFEAKDRKVFVTLRSGTYEMAQRLYEIEPLVTGRNFFRISKSCIVNLGKIVSFRPDIDRTLLVTMTSHHTLKVSRSCSKAFLQALRQA